MCALFWQVEWPQFRGSSAFPVLSHSVNLPRNQCGTALMIVSPLVPNPEGWMHAGCCHSCSCRVPHWLELPMLTDLRGKHDAAIQAGAFNRCCNRLNPGSGVHLAITGLVSEYMTHTVIWQSESYLGFIFYFLQMRI
jgi:hypothetical protein